MNQSSLSVSLENNNPSQLLVSTILSDISRKHNLDLSQDPVALERIREAVEKARLELDLNPRVEINLPYISANSSGPIHYRKVITRDDFGSHESESAGSFGQLEEQEEIEQQPQPSVQIKLPDRKPLVTYSLMVITVILYLLQLLTGFLVIGNAHAFAWIGFTYRV